MKVASTTILGAALLAAALGAGCGGAGDDRNADHQGIFFRADGDMLSLTEAVTATAGASAATVQGSLTNPGAELTLSSITVYITTNSGRLLPGSFDCGAGVGGVIYQPGSGGNYLANADLGSCTITATSVGTRPGEIVEGTFAATVAPMPAAPGSITITEGTFKAQVH